MTLAHDRLQAPRENRGLLIEPPAADVPRLLRENQVLLAVASRLDVGGRPLGTIRAEFQAALRDEALRYTRQYRDAPAPPDAGPLLLSGHQAELFHPGVWFKNFLLGRLAVRAGGVGVHLIVDNDVVKSVAIRVPTGSLAAPRVESVPYDGAGEDWPSEERRLQSLDLLASFPRRVAGFLEPFVEAPLVHRFWPRVLEEARRTANLGEALSAARHRLEAEWGSETLELPVSRLTRLRPFAWFARRLLDEAARLREVYNGRVLAYRRAHRMRSAHHPAPLLEADDGWVETPFWLWTQRDPRRRRAFVRRLPGRCELSDRASVRLPLAVDGGEGERFADDLAQLETLGVRLRPRALAMTMAARLLGCDLFLHGIGGAKYDEVTDGLLMEFWGLPAPPARLAATATLRLPLGASPASAGDLARDRSEAWAQQHHPERYLTAAESMRAEVAAHVAEKRRWIAESGGGSAGRQGRAVIRGANAALYEAIAPARAALASREEATRLAVRAWRVLGSREYSFCLFPERELEDFFASNSFDNCLGY